MPALRHVPRTPPAVAAAAPRRVTLNPTLPAPRRVIRVAPLPSESPTTSFGARAPAIALTAVAGRYGVHGFSGDFHSGSTDWGSSGQGGPLRKVASSPVDIPGRAARARTSDSRCGSMCAKLCGRVAVKLRVRCLQKDTRMPAKEARGDSRVGQESAHVWKHGKGCHLMVRPSRMPSMCE